MQVAFSSIQIYPQHFNFEEHNKKTETMQDQYFEGVQFPFQSRMTDKKISSPALIQSTVVVKTLDINAAFTHYEALTAKPQLSLFSRARPSQFSLE